MEGQQIGAYLIEQKLGEGGMGVVYVGVDVRLGRRAAIKQLLPALSRDRSIVERFFNEARAAASINHPGIVEVYDVGWHTDGSAFFAMKLLAGDSLARRLRAVRVLPIHIAATLARQVASALAAAHARGIVHRDLKPDNVVLVADEEIAIGERATVLDFGIAKLFGDSALSARTQVGSVMGTPSYMSPEQCRGAGEVDHRTDVYALGCIMFEMLTGRPPFLGEGIGQVLGMHQFVEPPTVRSLRPDAPPELDVVVMRALAKAPGDRQQDMAELAAALQPFASSQVAAARPSPPHIAAAATRTPVPTSSPTAPEPSTLQDGPGRRDASTTHAGLPSRTWIALGAGGLAVAAAVVVIAVLAGGQQTAPPIEPVGPSSAAASATPAPARPAPAVGEPATRPGPEDPGFQDEVTRISISSRRPIVAWGAAPLTPGKSVRFAVLWARPDDDVGAYLLCDADRRWWAIKFRIDDQTRPWLAGSGAAPGDPRAAGARPARWTTSTDVAIEHRQGHDGGHDELALGLQDGGLVTLARALGGDAVTAPSREVYAADGICGGECPPLAVCDVIREVLGPLDGDALTRRL